MNTIIPLLDLRREYEYMKADIDAAIERCLTHQQWILGPEVKELEEKVSRYLGVKHCVGVSSGTEALLISLRSLAIKTKGKEFFDKEDRIITTPFTFVATASSILRAGATPVFVDIDPLTFNVDTAKIKTYLKNSASKAVGIVPVHLYGQPCDLDAILDIANEYGLFVVEDACQAIGAKWKGKLVGSVGETGAFSLFPSKNLGGFGDAGMISTNDGQLATFARMLMQHGGKDKYNIEHVGYNARLDTLQAAVLSVKLDYLNEFNQKRKTLARFYSEGLAGCPDIVTPTSVSCADHVFHQYTIRVRRGKRDGLKDYLTQQNISTMVYYPFALHTMDIFAKSSVIAGSLEETEKASQEVLSLPIEPLQNKEESAFIVEHIRKFLSER